MCLGWVIKPPQNKQKQPKHLMCGYFYIVADKQTCVTSRKATVGVGVIKRYFKLTVRSCQA